MNDAVLGAFLLTVCYLLGRAMAGRALQIRMDDLAADVGALRDMVVGLSDSAVHDLNAIATLQAEAARDRDRSARLAEAFGDEIVAVRRDGNIERPAFLGDVVSGIRPGVKGGLN